MPPRLHKPRDLATIGLVVMIVVRLSAAGLAQSDREWAAARSLMVESDVAAAGIKLPELLAAMRDVPRHEFVPTELRSFAYVDMALPIGEHQTISPPFIVAYMTRQLDVRPNHKVLEIGTGSGYQAAILSRLAKEVYTIEINDALARRASQVFARLGYQNIHHRTGDGFQGWAEHVPFDRIMITCSPESIPAPLVEQLVDGGRIVAPLGERFQQTLYTFAKVDGNLVVAASEPTFFVPMIGKAQALRSASPDAPMTSLVNGDFERLLPTGNPAGWYYLRQVELAAATAPSGGKHHLRFINRVPGRSSQVLQAIGVDGRKVPELVLDVWVRADKLGDGAVPSQQPRIMVNFFDENHVPAAQESLGPWSGSFDWTHKHGRLKVPPQARVAVLAVGLLGATGELTCDNLSIRGVNTARR